MTTRTNYNQIAAKLNRTTIENRLEQMRSSPPPKTRKGAADLLAPFFKQITELREKGWTYAQLAKELSDAGLPVKTGALRLHLRKG
jgi:hypothetical protein